MSSFVPFILLFWTQGSVVNTAQFGSERACNIAIIEMQKQRPDFRGICLALKQ
jgi:hypothetical protein